MSEELQSHGQLRGGSSGQPENEVSEPVTGARNSRRRHEPAHAQQAVQMMHYSQYVIARRKLCE